jgi:hypothetical protein
LERDAVKRGGVEPSGPFDILAASALGIRRSKRDVSPNFDSWATLDVIFHVSDKEVVNDKP